MNFSHMSRREFMRVAGIGAAAFSMPGWLGAAEGKRNLPNIVYILADDLGYGDVQCLNPERGKIKTPNIDRLAKQGMIFTDAHSGSSVCTPTRYGILTGRYAWRSRLQQHVLGAYGDPLIMPERLTVPGMLKKAGYRTACIGKWHLGWNWPKDRDFSKPIPGGPTAVGFDYYFGTDVPNYPPYCFIENDRTVGIPSVQKPQKMHGHPGIMLPGWKLEEILPGLTGKACAWVGARARDQEPFFLYMPLTSPHTPIAPTAEWQGKSGLGAYGDFVMETDWAVGEVLKAIDKAGVAENTLVIFASDNGCAPYIGVQKLEAMGHFPSANYRGYKSDIWDGGHRIPFIARWPGKIKAGAQSDQLVCLTDLMATCAEIVGSSLPVNAGEDSVSILPALTGTDKQPLREAVVHHSINGNFSIRQGKWKLALCPGSGGWSGPGASAAGLPSIQLYDMTADPGEKKNLQAEQADVVEKLMKLLQTYVAEGRSTPGAPQRNDVAVDVWKGKVL